MSAATTCYGWTPRGGELLQLSTGDLRDVQQRPKWARREQRVAGAHQHLDRVSVGDAELPNQRALARACLARDERQSTAPAGADGSQVFVE
jgi:hypothetical protein